MSIILIFLPHDGHCPLDWQSRVTATTLVLFKLTCRQRMTFLTFMTTVTHNIDHTDRTKLRRSALVSLGRLDMVIALR